MATTTVVKGKDKDRHVPWILGIVLIIIMILLFVILIVGAIFINNILTHGVPVTISFGGLQEIRANFDTSRFSTFINRAAGSTVRIGSSSSNIKGKILRIKNNNDAPMTIDTSALRSFDGGNLPNPRTIMGRMLATFLFTGTNELLRTT